LLDQGPFGGPAAHHERRRPLWVQEIANAQPGEPGELLAIALQRIPETVDGVLSDVGEGRNDVDAVGQETDELDERSRADSGLDDADRPPPTPSHSPPCHPEAAAEGSREGLNRRKILRFA